MKPFTSRLKVMKGAKPKAAPESAKPKATNRIDKTEKLLALLKGDGATVPLLTEEMGWLPHTLRARISTLTKEPYSLTISRERKDGVTLYRIRV